MNKGVARLEFLRGKTSSRGRAAGWHELESSQADLLPAQLCWVRQYKEACRHGVGVNPVGKWQVAAGSPFLYAASYGDLGTECPSAPRYQDFPLILGFLLLRQITTTKRQSGEERVYLDYTSTALFIPEESQDRNSNRARI